MIPTVTRFLTAFLLIFVLLPGRLPAWPPPTPQELAFDKELGELAKKLEVTNEINPTAASEAREKSLFFGEMEHGRWIEPLFEYSPFPPETMSAVREFELLPLPQGPYSELLACLRGEMLRKAEMVEARATENFTRFSESLYPYPEPGLVLRAWRILREIPEDKDERTVTAASMTRFLEDAITEMKLDGWKVELSDKMSARAQVSPAIRRVKIKAGTLFSPLDRLRLKHHELGVHARRAQNGERMPLKVFRSGLSDYLTTEEGLAAYVETLQGIESGLRLFALRVLAVHWARTDPFSLIFRKLTRLGVEPEDAFGLCQRVKRGLAKTGEPGGYTKDVSYLRGFAMVSQFAERGGRIEDLMRFGKVGIRDLPALLNLETID